MPQKTILDKLSIYVPQKKQEEKPVERLIKLSEKRDRSINYLVVEAILEYLRRGKQSDEANTCSRAVDRRGSLLSPQTAKLRQHRRSTGCDRSPKVFLRSDPARTNRTVILLSPKEQIMNLQSMQLEQIIEPSDERQLKLPSDDN